MTTFRVQVSKDYLTFAAAHFITFAGHRCESLHGHNYRVSVALEGPLDPESWYVLNFVDLKTVMKKLCNEIDHRVLLPLENPKIRIGEQSDSITVAYLDRPRYVFPREDCVLLPIPNTTAEMLAQYLAGRLKAELGASADRLASIEMEVEESFGQSAVYRDTLSRLRSPDLRTGMGSG